MTCISIIQSYMVLIDSLFWIVLLIFKVATGALIPDIMHDLLEGYLRLN